jgi:hypothetical protein
MIMMFLAVAILPTLVTGEISKTSKTRPKSKAGKRKGIKKWKDIHAQGSS